ncbi:hypothetical protein HaLaN_10612, partial [Haematococcus lacustris]
MGWGPVQASGSWMAGSCIIPSTSCVVSTDWNIVQSEGEHTPTLTGLDLGTSRISATSSNAPMFCRPHGVDAGRSHDDALGDGASSTTSCNDEPEAMVPIPGSVTSNTYNTAYARLSPRPIAKHKLALPRAFQGVAGPPVQLSRSCKSWLPPFEKSTTLERLED